MDDYTEVELLEEFEDQLLGCVFDPEGNPIPCYDSAKVLDMLVDAGMSEDQAMDYVESATEHLRIVWVHPLEIKQEPGWTPRVVRPDGTLH
jgi:hypothetical protein